MLQRDSLSVMSTVLNVFHMKQLTRSLLEEAATQTSTRFGKRVFVGTFLVTVFISEDIGGLGEPEFVRQWSMYRIIIFVRASEPQNVGMDTRRPCRTAVDFSSITNRDH
jgi:hypothetical protein